MSAKSNDNRSEAKRPRRPRGTREQTREHLVRATLEVLRKEGAAGVTTVSVTREAGLAQSGFYMHFRNIEECLAAAAEEVAGQVRQFVAQDRREMHDDAPRDAARHITHYTAVLELFLKHRALAEILIRHRFDHSPLGQVMAKLAEQIRQDLVDDIWRLAEAQGIDQRHRERVELVAEFLVANVLAAGEALVDGRITDAELLSAELTHGAQAIVQDLFMRCKAET